LGGKSKLSLENDFNNPFCEFKFRFSFTKLNEV
jgi:hypothetical protein